MTFTDNAAPLLMIQAKPTAAAAAEFRSWILSAHLQNARKIPGVEEVNAGISATGTWYVLYTFADAGAFERALGSAEAAYARGTWERWDDLLERERVIEVLAPLMASSVAVRQN